jgi:hypothetical protein
MNNRQPEVSIIIVNYNVKELLLKCFASVYQYCKTPFEIILIDNNSTDDSLEAVRKCYPETIIIDNKFNAGFPKANNQGIEIAKGDYIFLLNPDTELLSDSITELIIYLKSNSDVSLIAPRLLNTDLSIQYSIQPFITVSEIIAETFYLHQFYKNRKSYFRKSIVHPIEVEALSGAAILMNKNVIEKIGMLDEDLFWTEDMEFCYRAYKQGLKIIYYPSTSILHHVGASGKKNLKVMLSKQVLTKITYFRKNHTMLSFEVVRFFRLLHIISRMAILHLAALFNANRFAEKAKAYDYTFVEFLKGHY